MTNEQKIIALAKLDGFAKIHLYEDDHGPSIWCGTPESTVGLVDGEWGAVHHKSKQLPNYLTSGDEIRRLIGKQPYEVQVDIVTRFKQQSQTALGCALDILKATPEQLAEALLRATGNWVE